MFWVNVQIYSSRFSFVQSSRPTHRELAQGNGPDRPAFSWGGVTLLRCNGRCIEALRIVDQLVGIGRLSQKQKLEGGEE